MSQDFVSSWNLCTVFLQSLCVFNRNFAFCWNFALLLGRTKKDIISTPQKKFLHSRCFNQTGSCLIYKTVGYLYLNLVNAPLMEEEPNKYRKGSIDPNDVNGSFVDILLSLTTMEADSVDWTGSRYSSLPKIWSYCCSLWEKCLHLGRQKW